MVSIGEGFYTACQTAKSCKAAGREEVRYPHRRKRWRTTMLSGGSRLATDAVTRIRHIRQGSDVFGVSRLPRPMGRGRLD